MSAKTILTNSSLTTFKMCPRMYQYKYVMRRVPVQDKEALFFGKLFHIGLDAMYTADVDFHKVVTETYAKSAYQDPYLLIKVLALLDGYLERYNEQEYETVETEKEFRAPLLNPETAGESKLYEIGGVIDKILKKLDGRILIGEHKTTSDDISPESDYWKKLPLDSQVSTYYLGAQANGHKIESCLYDVIKKPTIRPSQVGKAVDPVNPKRVETPEEYGERLKADIKERPDFYYARQEVPRNPKDLEEFLFDAWNIAQTIRSCEKKERFPRYTNSCTNVYGGKCEYFYVCCGNMDIADESVFKTADVMHQELKEEVKQ